MREREPYRLLGDLPDGLRAVEASAGTGKTYSITMTALRLVLERDVTLDRLLVVTFTRAATAELVERVRTRLAEAVAALDGDGEVDGNVATVVDRAVAALGEGEARARVETALQQVDEAQIATIHGFCQRVLQSAALAAGADPDLRVDGEGEQRALVARLVDDWTVAHLRHDRPHAVAYAHALQRLRLGRDGLQAIGRVVADETVPHVVPAVDDRDPRDVFDAAWSRWCERAPALVEALPGWSQEVAHTRSNNRLAPSKIHDRVAPLAAGLAAGRVPELAVLEEWTADAVAAKLRDGEPPRFSLAAEDLLDALTEVETLVRTGLARHVAAAAPAAGRAENRVGFSDVLRLLHEALGEPDRAARLRTDVGGAVGAVLVDEFQDTDPVQWRILRALFPDVEMFEVVGDPKQAIYGWRGADLETYLAAVEEADAVQTMGTNHRSDVRYVAACNQLFADVQGDDPVAGGPFGDVRVPYVEVAAADDELLLGPDGPLSGVELVLHPRPEGGDHNKGDLTELVAAHVADEVRRAVAGDLTVPRDDDHPLAPRSPVRPSDCAVLVRTNAQAEQVAVALRRRGVAAVLGGGRDVLASPEAAALVDLLAVLLDAAGERRLRRLLVGPFGGLDGPGLDGLDEAGRDRWAGLLDEWRGTWARRGAAALVHQAIRDGGLELRAASVVDGERVVTNLRHLAELLDEAERDEALGGHALLAWLQAQRAEATDGGRAPEERELRLERDDEAVKVLTVHAAKGLEYPLVWAPFLWDASVRAEASDTRTRPFVVNDEDDDHRRTIVLLPAATSAAADDERRLSLRRQHDREQWRAGLRLAYVALTRAAHRCTIHLGGAEGLAASPLHHLLLGRDHPTVDLGDTRSVKGAGPDDDGIRASLSRLADAAHHVSLRRAGPAPEADPDDLQRTPDVDARPVPLRWGRQAPLDRSWGRTSFTQLLSRRTAAPAADATESDALDHDADAPGDEVLGSADGPDLGAPVPLADLPRGADWGTFVHAVYEHLPSFDAGAEEVRAVAAELARTDPLPVTPAQLDLLGEGIAASLATPLGPALGGLRLADVDRADRLDELRFTLALADPDRPVDVNALAAAFADAAPRHEGVPYLRAAAHLRAGGDGAPVHGLLVGAIDLVLRERTGGHDRWWIADYKSNGLGEHVGEDRAWVEHEGHHTPERVLDAMVHGDYLLQAHLYVVALHRWLRSRLGAAYDYDRDVGGWAYLFVRGMTGADVRTDAQGRPHGVAVGRPDRALVERLEAVLAPEGAR